MENRSLKLSKIPITLLIQILGELFEEGADFIDIEGSSSKDEEESDVIKVTTKPEYYSEEPEIFIELEDNVNDDDDDDDKLTDEDINDLI